MSFHFRAVFAAGFLLSTAGASVGATPKEIQAAIDRGTASLKAQYAKGAVNPGAGVGSDHGIGPTALAGLALLEAGVKADDSAVKSITEAVRTAAYSESKTYQISLCLMFLDRLGEPADVPLIQALAVRLRAGQTTNGGWGYTCVESVPAADAQRLREMKTSQAVGKLHPEVEKYAQALASTRAAGSVVGGDDNSNTQFAVIAIWVARKHAVPVDSALDLIEKRFLATQSPRTGSWSYSGAAMTDVGGSPSMYCAGLIGLATGVARREERRLKADTPKKDDPAKSKSDPKKNSDDPFFNPPPKAGGAEPKKPDAKRPPDNRDKAVRFALAGLGSVLAESAKAGRGALVLRGEGHGHHDLYFFWSLERVGVIFGVDKIGGVDWFEAGAHTLFHTQNQDGSWSSAGGAYGTDVKTSFAVLFLCKSNLTRDLSSKVQKEVSTEMRNPGAGAVGGKSDDPSAAANPTPEPSSPVPVLPGVGGSEVATLAAELVRTPDQEWAAALKKLRDSKGPVYTQALVSAVARLDGERLKAARAALAERLTRMTADTLRTMTKAEDIELRRGAVLAMAMKDDKAHVSDLVAALMDEEDVVVRAAKAGLKSLTGEDFGPGVNSTVGEKKIAVDAWRDWLSKQKK